jgi:predicted TIM-barrel fold metal-dependent hydrolase
MAHPLRNRFLDTMRAIRTVDCHSHTALRKEYYAVPGHTLFTLGSYFNREIAAMRGSPDGSFGAIYGQCSTDEDRWKILKEGIARAGNTSYWRHNLVVYRAFFGLADPELDDNNWRRVNEAIKEKTSDPKWYRHVTDDVCGLRTQIRNVPWNTDWEAEYFTAVLRMEDALQIHEAGVRGTLAGATGRSIESLSEAKAALVAYTQGYNARGNRGIKLAHAYRRTLSSEEVPVREAETIFEKALRGGALSEAEVARLQDHVIFFLAGMAGDMGLVFQIHTGVQGIWGQVPHSDPTLLIPLLRRFRNVRFDLFHMGYPYVRELGMIGKHYPNVYLNMAWAYLISMEASRQGLSEWIDLVPGSRLLGFGSDVHWPEMVHGHLEMARTCIADVLVAKVERDYLSTTAALELLGRILHDNAVDLYRLS